MRFKSEQFALYVALLYTNNTLLHETYQHKAEGLDIGDRKVWY